jgi:hypothetical protein
MLRDSQAFHGGASCGWNLSVLGNPQDVPSFGWPAKSWGQQICPRVKDSPESESDCGHRFLVAFAVLPQEQN